MDDVSRPLRDPTADSALLLQRIGFFTLGVALPVAAMLSRRAAVVLAPIGVLLLVISALLSQPERFTRQLARRFLTLPVLLLLLFVMWTALSTVWGARGAAASERIVNLALAVGLGLAGAAALPERTRAANLYAVAVGVGAATALALGLMATGVSLSAFEDDEILISRGLAFAIILSAPICGWLLLRGRTQAAGAIAIALLAAVALAGSMALALALATALAAFVLVVMLGRTAIILIAGFSAALIVLSPLIALAAHRLPGGLVGSEALAALGFWAQAILAAPAKLVTGHGFGTVLAQQRLGAMPAEAPVSVLFEIWHELGLVGALAFAIVVWLAIRSVLPLPAVIQAGAIAAFVTALMLGVLGVASFRAWWMMTFAASIVLTTAIARGQGRTDRPLATFVQRRTEPPPPPVDQAAAG